MYSDFFDQLGANNRRFQRDSATQNNNNDAEPLVTIKAGKIQIQPRQEPANSFQCEAICTRGEIRLVWKEDALQWQWYNRREETVQDEFVIDSSATPGGTFERVVLADNKKHANDRIYVWTRPELTTEEDHYQMYWMQDANEEKEEEIVASINEYLANPQKAAPAGIPATSPLTAAATNNNNTATSTTNHQVDALSSILENLGMPQSSSETVMSTDEPVDNNNNTTTTTAPRATLTLADLQGAMAGIQEATTAPLSLSDVVTSQAITGILQNDGARQRLQQLLPAEQQADERFLEDNLRSPAVQQTLRHLTATLVDNSDSSGLYTVLANFQLDPARAQDAMAVGNPVQAFLDCVWASVQKEEKDDKQQQNDEGDVGMMITEDDDDDKNEEMEDSNDKEEKQSEE